MELTRTNKIADRIVGSITGLTALIVVYYSVVVTLQVLTTSVGV